MLRERASRLDGGLASRFRKNTARHQRLSFARGRDIGANFVDRPGFGRRGGRSVHEVTGQLEPPFGSEGSGPGQQRVDPARKIRHFQAFRELEHVAHVGADVSTGQEHAATARD